MRFLAIAVLLMPALSLGADSLFGKVMCGYQGWFSGPESGWRHYGFGKPGHCHIELWPDVSELGQDDRIDTPLKLADGTPAQVYDSKNAKVIQRHFDWMQEHGIDGIFLQRFGTELKSEKSRAHFDKVMEGVRSAAKASGRSWAVMYDLSGLKAGEINSVVMQDWKRLKTELKVTDDPSYQRHNGRPVVAVWGIGFSDDRSYTLEETHELLRFLHDNPEFGKMTVMAGVPWHWRSLKGDATSDPKLHEVLDRADIISPWAVGRYGSPDDAARQITAIHADDAAWCRQRGKDYLPVIFPGFSWSNLMKMRGQEGKPNAIPRLGGQFMWSQASARIRGGVTMLYVAMFDEMDEGTAIFKTTSHTPSGDHYFVTEPDLPSDHYLWLTGQIGLALRQEIPLTDTLPAKRP